MREHYLIKWTCEYGCEWFEDLWGTEAEVERLICQGAEECRICKGDALVVQFAKNGENIDVDYGGETEEGDHCGGVLDDAGGGVVESGSPVGEGD